MYHELPTTVKFNGIFFVDLFSYTTGCDGPRFGGITPKALHFCLLYKSFYSLIIDKSFILQFFVFHEFKYC